MKRALRCSSGSTSLPLDCRRLFYCILYFYDDHCRFNRVFLYIYKIYNSKIYKAMSFVSNYIYTLVPLIPAHDDDFICTIYVYTTMSYRRLCIYILLHDSLERTIGVANTKFAGFSFFYCAVKRQSIRKITIKRRLRRYNLYGVLGRNFAITVLYRYYIEQ